MGVDNEIQKKIYQCKDFVQLENSFILKDDNYSINCIEDLAVYLNPTEFENPNVVYDFSNFSMVDK